MSNDIQMVITDLDGTLFNDQQQTLREDLKTLQVLGDYNIIRVIATGRNLYSALNKLDPGYPIDYLIFSSGAGIYHWDRKVLIHSNYLTREKTEHIARILVEDDIDFMIHELIPHNHKFIYHKGSRPNPDFERRLRIYRDFAEPLDPKSESYQHSCQIIAITGNLKDYYQKIKEMIPEIKVIRTTSPLDGLTMWIEIVPEGVSKGHGAEWLCRYTHTDPAKTLSIGNDYNDIDLLDFTAYSFVVENAPEDLKRHYNSCRSNHHCGFTDAVSQTIDIA